MEHSIDRALLIEVARDILDEVAPRELPIFPAACNAYFIDPTTVIKQSRSRDAFLGMGLDPTTLLTPHVLHILGEVCIFLTGVASDAVKKGLADAVHEAVWSMIKTTDPKAQSLLSLEQIEHVREIVLRTARGSHLPAALAQSLANAVTARLVSSRK
ncbi:hypothetical protein [Burkholderia ubonensis]|uniref:hypothetical protein n=1 Tax=Burkholderia ubonensis TaxID=101571 RepID=UPI00075C586E|nr:hypothetical protein [Burkholderia ubonensis]KWB73558.1 hypothetical protein WL41_16840 [Burkholderia ubonensis]KWC13661.1 hypothetical protein WL46_02255 [Burkholderia ubonensis]